MREVRVKFCSGKHLELRKTSCSKLFWLGSLALLSLFFSSFLAIPIMKQKSESGGQHGSELEDLDYGLLDYGPLRFMYIRLICTYMMI